MRADTIRDMPDIAGWKPPVVYDIEIDKFRIATQGDVDRLTRLQQSYGEMRRLLKLIEEEHEHLFAACRAIPDEGER